MQMIDEDYYLELAIAPWIDGPSQEYEDSYYDYYHDYYFDDENEADENEADEGA